MASGPFVSLILPAYNEAKSIVQTVTEAQEYFENRRYSYEIIVSAEGDDGTREIVSNLAQKDPRLKITGTVERRGKGYGIRQGVALADGEIIGFSDADNKTPIEEFDKVAPLLLSGNDVVIGSRRHQDAQILRPQPFYRRLGSKGFALFMHAMVGLNDIADTQCGFKFFRRDVALDLFRRQRIDGYMFDVEILYLARSRGYRIVQVPVRWRNDGDSRLQLVRGNLRNVQDILRIKIGSAPKDISICNSSRF